MATKVKAIPDGYHAVTPYLSIKGAADAVAFYKRAFGAEELYRLDMRTNVGTDRNGARRCR